MTNGTGLMAEVAPEAIMPLKRGRDGKLGVAVVDGGGGNQEITIVVPVSIDGNVLAETTAKYIPRNSNLNDAIRRVH